jgi:hypothetical protein
MLDSCFWFPELAFAEFSLKRIAGTDAVAMDLDMIAEAVRT